MTNTISQRYDQLRSAFEAVGQAHVFTFWKQLDEDQRRQLLDDLSRIDVPALPALAQFATSDETPPLPTKDLEPPEVLDPQTLPAHVVERGRELLSHGKVAAFTVAGGQGTRLGFAGPKGAFPVSPLRRKTLFQLFAESIIATDRRYGCTTRWYVMTSPANDEQTRAFFEQNGYFGLKPQTVSFFQQGVMPAFDPDGRILLDQPHRPALSPDGHGGSLLALARTGMLADMARHGITQISYFQVDNPLVACLDPLFIGVHEVHGSEMSSKALPKADDLERVGNFVRSEGKLMVIEYSDLPESLARARNADGSRTFDAANIAVHLLARPFVERLTAKADAFGLPWHRARKKAPYIHLATGRRMEPAEPNAIKLESFIFDALPLARGPILLGTSRAEEFSPVKNATGVDSVETAVRDMSRRAARWLEASGFKAPRDAAGEPAGRYEISPLAALDAAQLAARQMKPRTLSPGEDVYIE